jgi:hypothetical protein
MLLIGFIAALVCDAVGSQADVGGHVKTFQMAGSPVPLALVPEDPWAQSSVAARLATRLEVGELWRLEFHPVVVAGSGVGNASFGTGVGRKSPEAIDLTWKESEGILDVTARVDWMFLKAETDGVRGTLGRQAISHGQGKLFSPLDVIAPFNPTTIDTEFKPGVDALRVEAFFGQSHRLDVSAAYLGAWDADGIGVVGQGTSTVGATDIGIYTAWMRGDPMVGASVFAPAGPVGIYGDVAVIAEEDAQLRGVLGADIRATPSTLMTLEVYHQTFGSDDPADALVVMEGERYARGELWLVGHSYAGLSALQTLSPLWNLSLMTLSNLTDPSALASVSLHWSASENAEILFGGMGGLGQAPDDVEPSDLIGEDGMPLVGDDMLRALGVNSEFGLVPWAGYLQTRFYF